jgi:HAD superfamily hydrolase (TIGR01509 family)
VLFDWDGTLVDSAEASFRCYSRVFESFGIPFDRATFAATYSPNWQHTYVSLGLPQERWPEADALWCEAYAQHANRLVPGALHALDRLQEAGLALAVVTSGESERVSRELSSLGVAGFFSATVYGEEATRRKPHPEPLLLGLERLDVPAAGAAYVGDSPEDVEMAQAAGVFVVGIPGGFPNQAALRASAPDLLAADLDEAVTALLSRAPLSGS